MRAIVVSELGGPEVMAMGERPEPVAGPGQVVVEVTAAGVNFIDIYRRSGVYQQQLPYVPGSEGAGTVIAAGEGVTQFSAGDRVAWSEGPGSYAERVAIAAEEAVPVPDGVDLKTAGAVMLQGMTAHYLCRSTYPVTEGAVTVVHAAAGGVGLLLTQLIKDLGGIVIATTSSAPKAALARQAGADYVTTYEGFPAVVGEVTGGRGADVVFDGVGQDTFDASLSVLRPRGMMVLFGGSSGQVPPFDLQRLNRGGSLYVTRPTLAHYVADRTELMWRASDLFERIAKGSLHVRIGAEYPLADASRAHADLAGRATTGKLILVP
ncbi:MAG TPA: quinone oxidoreductase [Trebonia sp.]|nr:quinone oxidoreductase [Trebonia sp.]